MNKNSNKIVDFRAKVVARRAEETAYFARMDRADAMTKILVRAVHEMWELGADKQQVINTLQVAIDEISKLCLVRFDEC